MGNLSQWFVAVVLLAVATTFAVILAVGVIYLIVETLSKRRR